MAPLDPSNTRRYFLDYSVGGVPHTLVLRVAAGLDETDVSGFISTVAAQWSPQMYLTAVEGMRYAAQGSNLTFSVPYSGPTTWGSGVASEAQQAGFVSWVGRSPAGRRARITLFGNKSLIGGGDFRLAPGDVVDFDDVRDLLEANPNYCLAIDGGDVVWNNYANSGYNAYWTRKLRG